MAFYRNTYPEAKVPIKMHLLEDHAVQWANTYHVGFGLLGEQGQNQFMPSLIGLAWYMLSVCICMHGDISACYGLG